MALSINYTLKDFDKNKIVDKYGMQENGGTQLFLANTCFRRMQKYVPFDTGALSITTTIKPHKVIYEQPYAHKQYTSNKGKGIRGKEWDKRMISAERDIIIKEVAEYTKKMKGNK